MKKLLLIFAAGLFSCQQTEMVTIDGCDYIKSTSITGNGAVESLTHKGNCSNPIHNRVETKKDTVINLPLIQKPL